VEDAPYIIEKHKVLVAFIDKDGNIKTTTKIVDKKIYDYPKTTIIKAIKNYRAGRKFWQDI
jgi:hypothetical protein